MISQLVAAEGGRDASASGTQKTGCAHASDRWSISCLYDEISPARDRNSKNLNRKFFKITHTTCCVVLNGWL